MEVQPSVETHAFPSFKTIVIAGLAGGFLLNAIDTPWSVMVMVPKMKPFFDAQGFASSPLTGPWFLSVHFLFTTVIAYIYSLMRTRHGRGLRTALMAGVMMLLVNRAFGFANVLMGIFPVDLLLGFSASMVPGTLIASVVSAWIIDRRN